MPRDHARSNDHEAEPERRHGSNGERFAEKLDVADNVLRNFRKASVVTNYHRQRGVCR